MRKTHLMILSAIILSAFALSACENTFHGAGQDVENIGESMQRAY